MSKVKVRRIDDDDGGGRRDQIGPIDEAGEAGETREADHGDQAGATPRTDDEISGADEAEPEELPETAPGADEAGDSPGAGDGESEADSAEAPPLEPPEDPRDLRIRVLLQAVEQAEERLREYIRAHKRATQETEAFKERLARDQQRELETARAKVVAPLLDVVDNFDRSLDAARQGGSVASLLDGLELVHRQLHQVLGDLGLERYDPVGETFDPATMEALGVVPVADPAQANTVVNTLKSGFRLGGRELRPALVQVGQLTPGLEG